MNKYFFQKLYQCILWELVMAFLKFFVRLFVQLDCSFFRTLKYEIKCKTIKAIELLPPAVLDQSAPVIINWFGARCDLNHFHSLSRNQMFQSIKILSLVAYFLPIPHINFFSMMNYIK